MAGYTVNAWARYTPVDRILERHSDTHSSPETKQTSISSSDSLTGLSLTAKCRVHHTLPCSVSPTLALHTHNASEILYQSVPDTISETNSTSTDRLAYVLGKDSTVQD